MAQLACNIVSPSSPASSLTEPQLLRSSSDADATPRTWGAESEKALLSSTADSEQCSLACEEDGSSLEVPEAAMEAIDGALAELLNAGPATTPLFIAADAREIIRNELQRQQRLQYLPVGPEARRFSSVERPRVVSWMFEVVSAYALSEETLHAAVSLLDRFVAAAEMLPGENLLQLLALACISIAAKHEEVVQRSAEEWISLAVGSDKRPMYECADLLRMEWLLLETVEWRIRVPNAFTFLRHYHFALAHNDAFRGIMAENAERASAFKQCANFLAELSLLDSAFLQYGYSTIATACLAIAEWSARGGAAEPSPPLGAVPGAQCTAAAAVPRPDVRAVAVLTGLAGVTAGDLAPCLSQCVQDLHRLHAEGVRVYSQAVRAGVWRNPPCVAELGFLAPVVARFAEPQPRPPAQQQYSLYGAQ